jgi:hypothetical protein
MTWYLVYSKEDDLALKQEIDDLQSSNLAQIKGEWTDEFIDEVANAVIDKTPKKQIALIKEFIPDVINDNL